MTRGEEGATVSAHQVATALKLGRPAVSRRLTLALKGGFLVNEEPVKGKPHKLRVGDPLPEEVTLPAPTTVFDTTTTPETVRTLEYHPETPRGYAETTLRMGQSNTPTVRVEHPHPSNGVGEQSHSRGPAETRELFEYSNGFRAEGRARLRATVPMAQSRQSEPAVDDWTGGEEGIL